MDFSSSRLSQSWLSSRLYLSCVILSDSVILLIDYQWAQVAAELNTVFGLFLVGNRGLAVSFRILPLPSNKDSGVRWDATTPTQHCSGCQRGNILLTPMETHFRSKDFLTMLVVIWQIWWRLFKKQTQEAVAEMTGGPVRRAGWTIRIVIWNSVLCRWIEREKHMPELVCTNVRAVWTRYSIPSAW